MNEHLEVERYELFAESWYHFEFDRRQFLKAFSGGLVLLVPVANLLAETAQRQGESGRGGFGRDLPKEIGAWIHIDEDGSITAYTGKVEMGQNIRTSLTQAIAEELRVPITQVRLIMGDTDLTPFDAGTFGSRTTPTMAPQLRKAAAAARETLIGLAAERWQVEAGSVRLADGRFVNSNSTSVLTFADLAKGLKLIKTIPPDISTTATSDWSVAGSSTPKVDGRDFVTGRHKYASDIKREGMLFGKVVRPSTLNSTLVSADSTQPADGAFQVVKDGDFIGVAATQQQAATRAADSIKAEWKSVDQPGNAELFEYFRKNAETAERGGRKVGSIADGLAIADKKLEQTYTVEYIAHAPLEPRAAVAEWSDGKLTVWTGTQRPFGIRGELAEAFRISEDKVRVIVPDTGSAYGGKHTGEYAVEAARLALATKKPVKLVWTRGEEFTWAYFRPAGVIDVKSGVKNDGTITVWEFHNYNSGSSAIEGNYDIPNENIQFHPTKSPLRQGSYRGLAATANHFARETHIDELASLVVMDPVQFRLRNLKDERLRAVLSGAADKFGWSRYRKQSDRGVGVACGFEKGSYIATCAEVSIATGGRVKLERVLACYECGAIVNPKHLENQVEGAIVMGLGGALFEKIEFANGTILNGRFSRYRVPRFSDVPPIEIVLLNRKDLPSAGAGETPIVGLAPAIGNAIFAATGKRLRALPLIPKGVVT